MRIANRTPRNLIRRSGFTLLEVLAVITILVVLAGTAVVYVPQYIEDSRIRRAQTDCTAWEKALSLYHLNNEGWPNGLEEVTKYVEGGSEKQVDPWGQRYTYEIITDPDNNNQEIPQVFTTFKGKKITKRGVN